MTETPTPAQPAWKFLWFLQGRSGRREYWVWVVVLFVIALGAQEMGFNLSTALAWPLMFIQIRRLHDVNRTGWWAVLALIAPVVALVPLMAVTDLELAMGLATLFEMVLIVVIGAIPGTPGENRFGPPAPFSWKRTLTWR